jgi:hypothetical protein
MQYLLHTKHYKIVIFLLAAFLCLCCSTASAFKMLYEKEGKAYYQADDGTVIIHKIDAKLTAPQFLYKDEKNRAMYFRTYDGRILEAKSMAGILSNTPDYDWYYGCTPTAAGMLMGYYDIYGYDGKSYENLVPGGTAELNTFDNPSAIVNDVIASSNHIADYYTGIGNSGDDPCEGDLATCHGGGDCLADFMGTSQDMQWLYSDCSAVHSFPINPDGSTLIWNYMDGGRLTAEDLGSYQNCYWETSSMYGIGEYVQYAGYNYSLSTLYNQYIYPNPIQTGNTQGFDFNDFKAEIDAGRPVLIHLWGPPGHTMFGYGYSDPETIYIRDTWASGGAENGGTMIWGGSYGGIIDHFAVTCLTLSGGTAGTVPDIPNSITYPENSDGNFTVKWSSANGATSYVLQRAPDVSFSSGVTVYVGIVTSYDESGLEDGTYYYRVKATNNYGESDWQIGQATNVDTENFIRKAIIIAGRRYEGDPVWEVTKDTCNWAFATLGFRQFNEDRIAYLTNDTTNVHRTGDATKTNIEAAISAAQDADDLLIFMHDHGSDGKFWLDYYSNIFVSPTDIDDWLDDIQPLEGTGPKVILIIEACYSGSFISQLQCEGQQERIIITSCSNDELSNMPNEGRLSFSRFFWNYTADSDTILTAFNKSTDDLNVYLQEPQHPQLDADGDGIPNEDPEDGDLVAGLYIGFQGLTAALRPHVGFASLLGGVETSTNLHGSTSATIVAEYIVSGDDIDHVWATIYPPGFTPDDPNSPIVDLPTIELLKNGDRYEGTYSNFRRSGIYTITVCAEDVSGLVSDPKTFTVRQELISLAPILNLLLLSD